jgi:hypothetical protein
MIIPVFFLESLQDCNQNATDRSDASDNDCFTHHVYLQRSNPAGSSHLRDLQSEQE